MTEQEFSFEKKFKAFNWNTGDNDLMNIIKITFSCKVEIPINWAAYLNDVKCNEKPEKRSNINYNVTNNKTESVSITFEKGILPTTGGHPFNDVWIEFKSSEDIVRIKKLMWFLKQGEKTWINKEADHTALKTFNKMLETPP